MSFPLWKRAPVNAFSAGDNPSLMSVFRSVTLSERCSPVFEEDFSRSGEFDREELTKVVRDIFKAHNWSLQSLDRGQHTTQITAVANIGVVFVSINVQRYGFEIVTDDEEVCTALAKLFREMAPVSKKKGMLHAVTTQHGSPVIQSIGHLDSPLIRINYEKDVVEAFDGIVVNFADKKPRGRLTLLDGPPGTGKSHLIRALTHACEGVNFVLVPSGMIREFEQPSALQLLVDFREDRKGPIVLLLEDADTALVVRQSDNISSITALLNFTDGLLGELLDIRVVATTNAHKIDIEPALLRPGRLSRHVHIGALSRQRAQEALNNLVADKDGWVTGEMTLAEVYAAASGDTAAVTKKHKVGFA